MIMTKKTKMMTDTTRNPDNVYYDDAVWWFITKTKEGYECYHYMTGINTFNSFEYQTGILAGEDIYSFSFDSLDEMKIRKVLIDGKLIDYVEWDDELYAFYPECQLHGDIIIDFTSWKRPTYENIQIIRAI